MCGRSGPISSGSPGATTSWIVPRSSRWRPWLSVRSRRQSRPSNSVYTPCVKPGRVDDAASPYELQELPEVTNGRDNSMRSEKFDVVILGGGNAGIGVTGPVRRAGMSVAMIESHDLGGTCPNRGCTPKKVLVAAGHTLHEIERAALHHISVGKPKLDWSALIDREKDLIKGHAVFAGPNAIRAGSRRLEAKHIVIATGSKPRPLPIPGAEHMITSDEMLSERELPGSVIFVGGGVISLEFGHVYARAGADVTVLEALQQLLPAMDADAVARIQTESERIGIRVKTGVSVKRIEPANNRLRVIFTHEGAEHAAEADRVVNGAGRVANVDTLNLVA